MDHFDDFLFEQNIADDGGLNELNFGLKPRPKPKLKSPAKFSEKKPPAQSATTSAEKKPPAQSATTSTEKKPPAQSATTSAEKKPPAQSATASADKKSPAQPATVSADKKSPAQSATASADKKSPAQPATVSTDKKSPAQSATASADKKPPAQSATVSADKKSPAQSATVSADKKSTAQSATASADKKSPAQSATASADKKSPAQSATVSADKKSTAQSATVSADKKSTAQSATVSADKKSTPQTATVAADIETFKREFAVGDNHVFFMLRNIKAAAPGVEHSSFRRSKLFANQLGVKVSFVTNQYQNDLLEQLAAYNVDAPVLNMYDYFQEINRAVEKPRKIYVEPMHEGWKIERLEKDWRILRRDGTLVMYCGFFGTDNRRLSYINFFNDSHKKIRRDYYDALGFLSCRQELDDKERPQEIFYYRPDGTLAAHELYELIKDKNTVTLMEIIDRNGNVTNVFKSHDEAISYWLLKIFGKTRNYFLVGDRKPEYNQTYIDLLAGGYDNVRVIQQVHNIHVVMGKPGEIPNPHKDPTVVFCGFLNNRRIKSDAIITLTEQQQADIAQRYKFDNVTAIPHALDDTLTIPAVKVDPFKIVQVGRIVEEKGQAQAVEVMRQVVKKVPQATLHFYGKGALQSTIQKIIDVHNLSKHIKFEGFSKNMPEVFASAAVSILPSRLEGFALVVQESLQMGTPVVAFDCSYGPSDMIQDGVNGFLVPVNDTKAMADRIIRILTEEGLRKKLSSNCARSIEKFSPQEVAGKWAKLFLKLMCQQHDT